MQTLEKTSQILFDFDKSFNKKIVGTDEAGRGPGQVEYLLRRFILMKFQMD